MTRNGRNMKDDRGRLILIAVIMAAFTSLVLLFTWAVFKKAVGPALPVPETGQRPESAAGSRPSYTIPGNVIPTVSEIEGSIKKRTERTVAVKKALLRKIERHRETQVAPESEPAADGRRPIPEKKEVVFPTYEERKAAESRTGFIAY